MEVFAKFHFRMSRKVSGDNSGTSSEYRHLQHVAEQMGVDVSELIKEEETALFPDKAAHVWDAFMEISRGRSYGMAGPNPISYENINSWQSLSGVELSLWEVKVIQSLDELWLEIMQEDKSKNVRSKQHGGTGSSRKG